MLNRMIEPMQCKDCQEHIPYNYHYQAFQCECGACYNVLGQPLRPIRDWQDEYDLEDY